MTTKVLVKDDAAKIAADEAKLNALKTERDKQANLVSELQNGLATNSGHEFANAVRSVLADGVSALDGADDLSRRLNKESSRLSVLETAVKIATRELDDLKSKASQRLSESRRPTYRDEVVKPMKAAIIAMQSAMKKHVQFRDELENAGGSFNTLQSMAVNWNFEGWLADAATYYAV